MSLSLPDNYRRSNFEENWIFQLYNNDTYLSFDGVNDLIDLGTTSSSITGITSNITVSFWVRFSPEVLNSGTNVVIFESNTRDNYYSGFRIYKDTVDRISIFISDSGNNTDYSRVRAGDFDANIWYFVTITSDMDGSFFTSSNTKIYIDNVLQVNSSYSTGWDSSHSVGYSGSGKTLFSKALVPDPDTFSKFQIKNFAIWNVQLNSNNRTAIYNSGAFTTLKNNFGNYNKSGNLKAYWEFNSGSNYVEDLSGNIPNGTVTGAKYGGFLPLALSDTTVDDVTYHGFVTKAGSIRDTINLQNSTAKSSNLTISVGDFIYENDNLSKQVLFGNKYYINKTVKVYSQPINKSNIDSCVQIYNGRLTDVDISSNGLINFSFASKTPWDFITFPQTKTDTTQQYIPVVYGNYTGNTYSDKVTNMDYLVHPVPIMRLADPNMLLVTSKAESSILPHYYEPALNAFIPLNTSHYTAATLNQNSSYDSVANVAEIKTSLKRAFKTRAISITGASTHTSGSDRLLLHSGSTQGMGYSGQGVANTFFNFPLINGKITELDVLVKGQIQVSPGASGSSALSIQVFFDTANKTVVQANNASSSGTVNSTSLANILDNTSSTFQESGYNDYSHGDILSNYQNYGYVLPPLRIRSTVQHGVGFGVTATTLEFLVHYLIENDFTSESKAKASYKELEKLEYIYLGNDGLSSSIADTTTVSGTITSGLHAHRDLLARFTGYDVPDSDLYNWSSDLNVNSLRSAWNIRYWALEPVELKKVLKQIQKEFAFIFKWRPNGEGSYWTVKDSYSPGDEVTTLDIDDISNLKINHTPFSDLITKIDVNYKKHPADDRMLLAQTSQDLTSSPTPRDKWSIRTKENLLSVDLEMNADKPGNEDVGHADSDPNDGYADYYMNIFGDIKKVISCEIVNPAKGYILETGDIIKFDIDEIKPFGGDWTNYYMITSVQRSIGKIKINCREVG